MWTMILIFIQLDNRVSDIEVEAIQGFETETVCEAAARRIRVNPYPEREAWAICVPQTEAALAEAIRSANE